MRETGAVYGGEMSAHHYFREFFHCDSGMVPWVLMLSLLAESGPRCRRSWRTCGGASPPRARSTSASPTPQPRSPRSRRALGPDAVAVDRLDGLTLEFDRWRLNLRGSNTEPLLRLNIETREDPALVTEKVAEVSALVGGTPH
jgi:phosphomannomutase